MKAFLVACVDKYLELTTSTRLQLKNATTPCLDIKVEALHEELEEAQSAGSNAVQGTWNKHNCIHSTGADFVRCNDEAL